MTLYEIDQAIEEALNKAVVDEETGEVIVTQDLEALESLQMARDQKIENVALFVKNANADAVAIAEEIKWLQARKKTLDNKIEGAKNWLQSALNGEKFSTPRTSISYRTTKDTTIIDDPNLIPDKFFPIKKNERTVSKTALKEAIKAGETVPGAHLEDTTSMILK